MGAEVCVDLFAGSSETRIKMKAWVNPSRANFFSYSVFMANGKVKHIIFWLSEPHSLAQNQMFHCFELFL